MDRRLQLRVLVSLSSPTLASLLGRLRLAPVALVACVACASPLAAGCAAETDSAEVDEDGPDEADGEPTGTTEDALTRSDFTKPSLSADERATVLAKYDHVDPNKAIDARLREAALVYYDVNKSHLTNTAYVAVVDFKKPSSAKRFFMIDMKSGSVTGYVTAHGSGSDPNNDGSADKFSNVKNSNASSLGFYATAEIYSGKWGRSLALDGLSDTNSNVRARRVVVHGASYVKDGKAKQGRSWGCFALPLAQKDGVISKLAGGALIYADR